MKRAYLVTLSIKTRVEIDSQDDEAIAEAAMEKILKAADQYVINDNVVEVEPDTECPTEAQAEAIKHARQYIEQITRKYGKIDFSACSVEKDYGPNEYYGVDLNTYYSAKVDSRGDVRIIYEYDNGHDTDLMADKLCEISDTVIEQIADAIKECIE